MKINPFEHFFHPTTPSEIAFTLGFTVACAILAVSLPWWIVAAIDSYKWHRGQIKTKTNSIFGESGAVVETK